MLAETESLKIQTISENAPKANILIVDDRRENLLTLKAILEDSDLTLFTAQSGNEALALTLNHSFACILLDVEMPILSGFEVAKILHNDPVMHTVPIIFMTAHRADEMDVFEGYKTGAFDYLVKPIQPEIVRSKVRVFADLFRRQLVIQQLNTALQETSNELQQVTKAAAHDLKEPVRRIVNYCQLLEENLKGSLQGEAAQCLQFTIENAKKVYLLLDAFVAFLSLRNPPGQRENIDVIELVRGLLVDFQSIIESAKAEITVEDLPSVYAHRSLLRLGFCTLLDNALKFRSDRPLKIRFSGKAGPNETVFGVHDTGRGVSGEYHKKIFELFQRLDPSIDESGSGTGLAVCRKIIEGHGGRIWLESTPGKGSSFYFSIPTAPP